MAQQLAAYYAEQGPWAVERPPSALDEHAIWGTSAPIRHPSSPQPALRAKLVLAPVTASQRMLFARVRRAMCDFLRSDLPAHYCAETS